MENTLYDRLGIKQSSSHEVVLKEIASKRLEDDFNREEEEACAILEDPIKWDTYNKALQFYDSGELFNCRDPYPLEQVCTASGLTLRTVRSLPGKPPLYKIVDPTEEPPSSESNYPATDPELDIQIPEFLYRGRTDKLLWIVIGAIGVLVVLLVFAWEFKVHEWRIFRSCDFATDVRENANEFFRMSEEDKIAGIKDRMADYKKESKQILTNEEFSAKDEALLKGLKRLSDSELKAGQKMFQENAAKEASRRLRSFDAAMFKIAAEE